MGVRNKEKKKKKRTVSERRRKKKEKGEKDFVTWNAAGLVTPLARSLTHTQSELLGITAATLITPSSRHLKGKAELLYWQVWAMIMLIIHSAE